MNPKPTSGPTPLRCVHYVDRIREEEGGVVRAVLDLTGALSAAGAEVTLLTGDATDAPAEWRGGGAPGCPRVVTINGSTTPWLGLGGGDRERVGRLFDGAGVFHLHTPWDPCNVAIAAEARRRKVPYVVSVHGMLDDWSMAQQGLKKRLYLRLFGRRMLEGAARLHFTAEGERRQAMRHAPRATPAVMPLLMDLAPYRELPGPEAAREAFPALQDAGAKLLFLSRVHPKKGVEVLIDAVAQLSSAGSKVTAMIAGPGEAEYLAELQQRAESQGVADRVHLLGMVRGPTKLSLYQACDLFVLPTSQENFGIVLTEAMACRTPVVTTRGVDIWPELEERGATILDAQAAKIAEATRDLLADPTALAERGARSRQAVLEWLEPEAVVGRYLDLYREVARP